MVENMIYRWMHTGARAAVNEGFRLCMNDVFVFEIEFYEATITLL